MRELAQGFYVSYSHTALIVATMKYLEQSTAKLFAGALESVKLPEAFQRNESYIFSMVDCRCLNTVGMKLSIMCSKGLCIIATCMKFIHTFRSEVIFCVSIVV